MTDQYRLPMRNASGGEHIETRPSLVEEWLTSLPRDDFRATGQLLYDATLATNQQLVKPSVRLQLVELYNRPYQEFIDTQIKTGAQHTLQSIETMKNRINLIKHMGYACKMAAENEFRKNWLWRQSKPPLKAMLLSLNYFSHALIFSYLEYSPAPRNIWREMNSLYDHAETLGMENSPLALFGDNTDTAKTTIAQSYKRIVLASLSDPHQLPFGAVWEIFEQLLFWVNHVHITRFGIMDKASGYFVVDLENDSAPLPYFKFNQERVNDKHRLVDATSLSPLVEDELASINRGQGLKENLKLSPYYTKLVLGHLARAWGLPPKRYFPREERKGIVCLACGLNSVYFFINGGTRIVPGQNDFDKNISVEESDPADQSGLNSTPDYKVEEWNLVDQGPGGIAVNRTARPGYNIRIGDIVAITDDREQIKWTVGVIRWMMVRQTNNYKIGIQVISKTALPAVIRACSGSALDSRFQRALLLTDDNDMSIITGKGLFMENRELEIKSQHKEFRVKAITMLESTLGFEYFHIR